MGLLDVLIELGAVVDEVNESVEVAGVHGEEHTGDLSVVLGHGLEHGVEEVVSDGGLGVGGLHLLEVFLGGESENAGGGGDGGSSGHDGDGLVDSGAAGHTGAGVVRSTGIVGAGGTSASSGVELRRVGSHGGIRVHLLLNNLLGGNALRADGTGLVVADNQGLGVAGNGVTSSISDSLLGGLSSREADISEATGLARGISSNAGRGDGTELGEMLLQNIISNSILQGLHEQVGLHGLTTSSTGQRGSTLRASLGTSNEQGGVIIQLVLIHLSNGLNGIVVVGKVDETIRTSHGGRRGLGSLGRLWAGAKGRESAKVPRNFVKSSSKSAGHQEESSVCSVRERRHESG